MSADINNMIQILTSMLNELSLSSDLSKTLNKVLKEIIQLIQAEAGSFFQYQANSEKLVCEACYGPVNIQGLKLNTDQGIVGEVFASQTSKLIEDVKKDASHLNKVDENTGFQTKSLMTVPILFDQTIYGCLQALNKNSKSGFFEQADLEFFELLAVNLGIVLKNIELTEKAVQDKLIEKDIADAKIAQAVLFPDIKKFKCISGGVQPYRELSGDFIDYFEVEPNKIAFIQGDVSGKGVPATILMSRCVALFRLFAKEKYSASEIAILMNNEIYGHGTDDRFATAIMGWFDTQNNAVEFVNCGHNPLIHYFDGSYKEFGTTAPPLGITGQAGFIPDNQIIQLKANESIYISTDGITEAKVNGKDIDSKGLAQIAHKQAPMKIASERYLQIKQYLEKPEVVIHDDATLLVILPKT